MRTIVCYKSLILTLLISIYSCNNKKNDIIYLSQKWTNKEIIFPRNTVFTFPSGNTIPYSNYKSKYNILVYTDTTGCTDCRLHLSEWYDFIKQLDTLSSKNVSCLFFFDTPKSHVKKIKRILQYNYFDHPVCFDYQDSLNKLNHFPADMRFQTFLLDSANRVKVIGNPIHNPKIKELYLKVLTGDSTVKAVEPNTTTTTEFSKTDMGKFPVKESRKAVFTLVNTGQQPLIVSGITTSCGCASVDYNKQPVKPGDKLNITVEMKPENTGYFEKTISVHCNSENSPILLNIKGQAE